MCDFPLDLSRHLLLYHYLFTSLSLCVVSPCCLTWLPCSRVRPAMLEAERWSDLVKWLVGHLTLCEGDNCSLPTHYSRHAKGLPVLRLCTEVHSSSPPQHTVATACLCDPHGLLRCVQVMEERAALKLQRHWRRGRAMRQCFASIVRAALIVYKKQLDPASQCW